MLVWAVTSQAQTDDGALAKYRTELNANPQSSLAHFRIGEILVQRGNYQMAANEFRDALRGDLEPRWIEVWSHVNLGKIFDSSGQRDRAVYQYKLAERTGDNTRGALDEAQRCIQAPCSTPK
jgi:tetratricopeptide (TPR) repeat protein